MIRVILLLGFMAFVLYVLFGGNDNKVRAVKTEYPPVTDGDYSSRMSSGALTPYTQSGYPKTVAKYGSRLEEIQAFRQAAAEKAIDSGKCDRVEMVELSTSKSSLDHLHFWVDCTNGQRLIMDEFQLQSADKFLTQAEKAWSTPDAIGECAEMIKANALIPSKVDIHAFTGTGVYVAPVTSNVVVTMNFDAQNAMGVDIPYTANCVFEPGKSGVIEVSPRQ